VVCLGVLFFYKYFNFLAGSFSGLVEYFGGEAPSIVLDLILPVGISFYTFQTLSYVIDVYRGDVAPERNFFFYALFVSFFPQLVAGPIERPGNLIPQLKAPKKFNAQDAIKGGKHMIVGFFKKICVADVLAVYVNAIYNDVENATALGVVLATVLFAVQIYCDFSGYTDIAIGCSRILGIKLMQNFNHPYTASSIKEFWQRWHISLSGWFRDYLYIPLGGSRCAKWRHLMNLFIVFLVSGLWHGANWTYVIWGAVHGIYQIVGNLTIKPRNRALSAIGLNPKGKPITIVRRVITFALVCFAWLFFRANSVSDAGALLGTVAGGSWNIAATVEIMGITPAMAIISALAVLTLVMIDHLLKYEDTEDGSAALVKNGAFIYYVWMIIFIWAIALSQNMTSNFIYFQF
jgi:D-alanyl-lipoteichoic acid acyltransferase DltB (MBOAT superfamily)